MPRITLTRGIWRITKQGITVFTVAALTMLVAGTVILLEQSTVGASAPSPTAYVANSGTNTVTPINTSTNTAESPITVGNAAWRHRRHPQRKDRLCLQ